ncbi:MAG TPA: cystathionine gamma-synthase [Gemmatimonadales bacterium]|nr:cystathionine gamma-synthase [Gemmatimonadales bacterium]
MSQHLATTATRAGIGRDRHHNAVVPPIHLSANYAFPSFGVKGAYDYTRSGNPTRDLLAEAIAELEGGEAGIITATGMAAVTLVLQLVGRGERVIAPHDCYGGTWRLLDALHRRGLLEVTFVDQRDSAALDRAFLRPAKLLWIETPSNPLLRVTDIAALAARGRAAGALVVADNTFLSPVLQRPIVLGAALVIHSTTKYLNGHSDVVGGAVVAADKALGEELKWWANCLGVTASPFDSWLTLRGLRTLSARIRQHEWNAAELVSVLDGHPAVRKVWWPGLTGHPGHDIARRQQSGYGAMVSFELHDGESAVRSFVDGLRHFTLAESLGGVESLVAHPATMTHASMSADARRTAGISDSLLRLSVGIEDPRDLVVDVEQALDRALLSASSALSASPGRLAPVR